MDNSILDKVKASKELFQKKEFNPQEIVSNLFRNINLREAQVLSYRFGLGGEEPKTLEEIGARYKVTRERIRQIEHIAIQKLKKLKNFEELTASVYHLVKEELNLYGGIRAEEILLKDMLEGAEDKVQARYNLLFILNKLLKEEIHKIDLDKTWPAFKLKGFSLELFQKTIEELVSILENKKEPLNLKKLVKEFKLRPFYQASREKFLKKARLAEEEKEEGIEKIIESYALVSKKLKENPFGEWGLSFWPAVTPKRMSEKIYLIFKKYKKPLHFTKITKLINETHFDEKQAHAPTVHNELILDKRFVLVGRGIYALREWGYKEGVVRDILEEILKREKEPLSREELVKEVLKQRMVKKSTIHLALTDKIKFKRLPDGKYQLVT